MNEKLISGYAAYTTADEYAASAVGDAPASTPILPFFAISVASWGVGAATTYYSGC